MEYRSNAQRAECCGLRLLRQAPSIYLPVGVCFPLCLSLLCLALYHSLRRPSLSLVYESFSVSLLHASLYLSLMRHSLYSSCAPLCFSLMRHSPSLFYASLFVSPLYVPLYIHPSISLLYPSLCFSFRRTSLYLSNIPSLSPSYMFISVSFLCVTLYIVLMRPSLTLFYAPLCLSLMPPSLSTS